MNTRDEFKLFKTSLSLVSLMTILRASHPRALCRQDKLDLSWCPNRFTWGFAWLQKNDLLEFIQATDGSRCRVPYPNIRWSSQSPAEELEKGWVEPDQTRTIQPTESFDLSLWRFSDKQGAFGGLTEFPCLCVMAEYPDVLVRFLAVWAKWKHTPSDSCLLVGPFSYYWDTSSSFDKRNCV